MAVETLTQLAQNNPNWSLDDFVKIVNLQLPQFLPEGTGNTRVRESVTVRLVRHYTSLGMVDEPLKQGREARYTYRHMLQLLLVRRLLAEGYGSNAIGDLAISKNNGELEAMLQGGLQLSITVANPALAFLKEIQERETMPAPQPEVKPKPAPPSHNFMPPVTSTRRWIRIELVPGLELHIREDFVYPRSTQEQNNLLQFVMQQLHKYSQQRRSSK